MNKFDDIRWKWLEERGLKVYADPHQLDYVQQLWKPVEDIQAVFCEARAGTGKTTLAVLCGAYEVYKGTYDRIIYVRNAVSIRDQGFLPGGEKEKNAPYMAPVADALELIQPGTFEEWVMDDSDDGPRIVPLTTSYVRGVTWDNAYVIFDEIQNADLEEIQAVFTRCSRSSKVVAIGSRRQCDNRRIKKIKGMLPFEVYMEHYREFPHTSFHELITCYRGPFADHADDIQKTVERLMI
jgi:predicted ribonuclease YlaK